MTLHGQRRVEGVGRQRAGEQVVVRAQVVPFGRGGAGQAQILVGGAPSSAAPGPDLLSSQLPVLSAHETVSFINSGTSNQRRHVRVNGRLGSKGSGAASLVNAGVVLSNNTLGWRDALFRSENVTCREEVWGSETRRSASWLPFRGCPNRAAKFEHLTRNIISLNWLLKIDGGSLNLKILWLLFLVVLHFHAPLSSLKSPRSRYRVKQACPTMTHDKSQSFQPSVTHSGFLYSRGGRRETSG